jgi:hypothetical protein
MGVVLASVRTVPRIRCSQTMYLYGPEVGFGVFCNQRHVEFVRELNDGPSRDRWYPLFTMTRYDWVQRAGLGIFISFVFAKRVHGHFEQRHVTCVSILVYWLLLVRSDSDRHLQPQ